MLNVELPRRDSSKNVSQITVGHAFHVVNHFYAHSESPEEIKRTVNAMLSVATRHSLTPVFYKSFAVSMQGTQKTQFLATSDRHGPALA